MLCYTAVISEDIQGIPNSDLVADIQGMPNSDLAHQGHLADMFIAYDSGSKVSRQ